MRARRALPEMRIRFSPVDDQDGLVCLSAYSGPADLELSRLLPVLESLGLWIADELHWTLREDERRWHVYDVRLRRADGHHLDLAEDADRVADAVLAQWTGRTEVDGLNRLVVHAGLDWSDVDLLRAMVRYRRQIDPRYTVAYGFDVLVANPSIAHDLVALFAARFDPERHDAVRAATRARVDHRRVRRRGAPRRRPHPARAARHGGRRPSGRTDGAGRTGRSRSSSTAPRVPDCPLAGAVPRDLRARPRRAGHPPPGRARRSGRHPLERPTAGPPHRGPRPDAHAGAEERADRADRREGRLRARGAVRGRRRAAGRRAGRVRGVRRRAARPHRRPARTARWSPVPGRLDGDDPYLVVAADRGTAAFCDVANRLAPRTGVLARRRVRLRRLQRLRPQGAGRHRSRRLGGASTTTSPSSASTCRPTRSRVVGHRRHVRRRVRQRHAALASHPRWWPRSTTATSSSTPTPTRRPRSPSGPRLSRAARLVVAGLRPQRCSAGRWRLLAGALKRIELTRQVRAGPAGSAARAHAGRADPGDPAGAGRPAVPRRDRHVRAGGSRGRPIAWTTGPTPRCGSRPSQLRARVVGEGANLGVHAAGPHRVRPPRRARSTWTPSTTPPASTPPTGR